MLDVRGYSCPIPVVMVQKEVKTNAPCTLDVLADNRTAVENITRFANKQGYTVTVTEQNGDFRLLLTKGE